MANVLVGAAHGAGVALEQQLPRRGQYQAPAATSPLIPVEFPRLHPALTLSRHEVDTLGGLHLIRADFVEHDLPDPAAANYQPRPPHDDTNPQAAVPHIVGANVVADAALDH